MRNICSIIHILAIFAFSIVGDLVYSYDTITGEVTQKEVTAVFVRESDHINYLTIIDEHGNIHVLETTDGHPFWVVTDEPDLSRAASDYSDGLYHGNLAPDLNGYWVEAKDLRSGDVFLGANGELSVLVSVERVQFDETIKVYNFTVDGNHDYFVLAQVGDYGQTCILVHNAKKYGGETSATKRGREAHKNYENALPPPGYEFNKAIEGSRLRPDAIDYVNKIVRELKPDSKSGIARGMKQLQGYFDKLGPDWCGFLDFYRH